MITNDYYIPAAIGTVVCQEKRRRDESSYRSKKACKDDFSLAFEEVCNERRNNPAGVVHEQ